MIDAEKGREIEEIKLPVENVTSCTWGGENLDQLYVTSAAISTDLAAYPEAGFTYKVCFLIFMLVKKNREGMVNFSCTI